MVCCLYCRVLISCSDSIKTTEGPTSLVTVFSIADWASNPAMYRSSSWRNWACFSAVSVLRDSNEAGKVSCAASPPGTKQHTIASKQRTSKGDIASEEAFITIPCTEGRRRLKGNARRSDKGGVYMKGCIRLRLVKQKRPKKIKFLRYSSSTS